VPTLRAGGSPDRPATEPSCRSLAPGTARPAITPRRDGRIAGLGDAGPAARDDNGLVDLARDVVTAWRRLAAVRRLVAFRPAPAVAAVVLALGAVAEALLRDADAGAVGLTVLTGLAAVATALPLALPRPTPAALAVIAAGALSLGGLGLLTVAGAASQGVAAYRLGRFGRPAAGVPAGLPYLLVALLAGGGAVRVAAVLLAGLLPAVALAGAARRLHREHADNRAERAANAGALVAHTARGERARIARELHDVVAHHVSMVVVQAENARLTTAGMPEAGAARLLAIGDTARTALTEMRRLLGVLREDTRTGAAERQPQPCLRQLADLLDASREASGAATRLVLRGAPVDLDPGVELAAYRIAQEALTNARRHAGRCAVDVELHYTPTALRLLVRDNGPGPAAPPRPGAHGLLGMRERAAAVGGTLRAGPATVGGFLVEATLPARGERA
jgi:signal transduction histidine kinase